MERFRVQIVTDIIYRLKSGQSERAIAKDLACSRMTVRKYHELAESKGYLELFQEITDPAVLLCEMGEIPAPPNNVSTVEPYRKVVEDLLANDVEMAAIHSRLRKNHGYTGSYSSIRRFVKHLRPVEPVAFVRIEKPAGQEAQVDFGGAGKMLDPCSAKMRQAYCFVMTLSFSRHQYVEFVFDQKMETWIGCHKRAFEWFGGVPREMVLDNLKAAVIQASLEDPVLSEPYRKLAQHYGLILHPCRVRTPEHKGKVENGVRYVKRNFLAGETFLDIDDANRQVKIWVMEIAGLRDHGTIHEQPIARFERERDELLRLPDEPFELLSVRMLKLHPDCHVEINGSYYSAPHTLIGKTFEVHVYERVVQIYNGVELLVTHGRAKHRGERITLNEHYPPEKVIYLMRTPSYCIKRSEEIGESCAQIARRLFSERPLDQLRSVQHIVGLTDKYGPERVEAACARALHYGDGRYRRIKGILESGLDMQMPKAEKKPVSPRSYEFARGATEFFEQQTLDLFEQRVEVSKC